MGDLAELVAFLSDPKPEVRRISVEHVAGFTGSADGRAQLRTTDAAKRLVRLTGDVAAIAHQALKALINLAAEEDFCAQMVQAGLITRLVDAIKDPDNKMRELHCALLSNATQHDVAARALLQVPAPESTSAAGSGMMGMFVQQLLWAFSKTGKVAPGEPDPYQWLGPVFANITKVPEGRKLFAQTTNGLLAAVLPYMSHSNLIRRGGAIAVLRNVCSETDAHEHLVKDLKIIPLLVEPLAAGLGPFSSADTEKMSPDLLRIISDSVTKKSEPDPELRKLLVDALFMLAASRFGRDSLRAAHVYPVLRDLHKVDKDEAVQDAITQLVEYLIRDEEDSVDQVPS